MWTYGSDPELFVTVDGKAISHALLQIYGEITKIGGDDKHPIYYESDDILIIGDGVAFEFTLKQPHTDGEKLWEVIQGGIASLKTLVPTYNVAVIPTVEIDLSMYLGLLFNPIVEQGFIFGCDKDYDAIQVDYNCNIMDVKKHPWRYGGGHFHIGNTENDIVHFMHNYIIPAVQILAIFIGNTAIANSTENELDKKRVFHYGNPGRYRPQRWGIEYRSPSNNWITSLDTTNLMAENSAKAMDLFVNNPTKSMSIIEKFLPSTVIAITEANQELSHTILNDLKGF